MTKLLLIASVVMLSACGKSLKYEAEIKGYAETCISNVTYYQFTSGVTVAYNKDGTIKTCEENK